MWKITLKTDDGFTEVIEVETCEEAFMLLAKFKLKYPTWWRYLKREGRKS